jgi:DNA-binding CsgD family transcriptional regulator
MTATGEKWPTRDDYQSAVLHPQRNVKDSRLHALQVEMRQLGMLRVPFPRSGNFGAVYKFTAPHQSYALKVFASTQPDREQRYRMIDTHLKSLRASPHLVSFSYDQAGIRVNGRWYPTLIMDWVEGKTLDAFLLHTLQQQGQVDNRALCQAWVELMLNVGERRVAQGDLQHGNILVLPNGALQLVDYDGMFVPAMKSAGLTAAEIGLPAYQHPKRYRGYFDERLDHFSALVILLTLACVNKPRWQQYHTDDNCLLVRESDLLHPAQSPLLNELVRTAEPPLKKLANILKAAATGDLASIPAFPQLAQDSTLQQLWQTNWRPAAPPQEARKSRSSSGLHCRDCLTELQPGSRFCTRCATPVPGAKPPPVVKLEPGNGAVLTPREQEVLQLLVDGFTEEQMAARLGIQRTTVKKYVSTLMQKAGVISHYDLRQWGRQRLAPHTTNLPPVAPPVSPPVAPPVRPPVVPPVVPTNLPPNPPAPEPSAAAPLSFFAIIGKSIGILLVTVFGWWLGSMLLSFVTFGLGQMIFDEAVATRITQWAVLGLFVLAVLMAIGAIAEMIKHRKTGGSAP